ncbi:TRAP transporter small permease [Sulfitobacter mediterraneus]|jgi:TRAP-type C4-dicarboxylate transport system permease small subunit|uniref:TRAP transporter small permease subunit n=1 Tax=Sulfitobacter TaxID=60136 RepID=UPI0019337565|nr:MULTISPECIES: TRAP transporter small permease [Sulfitobacter]MBM1631544.1 TRAP transporter small permease [Sulfitobacter mediterraneus]MBM1639359.1 TRAP transporter small permease [Sulfitobacter mediterraneus]MBM1643408.1 TRAP transporter small permease [Sulfitobacter mediterraneus]MBM1647454.1 TRAP transporter small permease [Sulfitobacter mediterraneus]MBM1651499.1 TRAP transporter small permease [Sulfitobacter mediterraneus]
MAGSAAVLEDSSILSKLDRALLPIERFCALLSGLAIFSLMFLAAYSVTGRKFFASPLAGYVDYIEAAMPIIAIMGVSYVQRDGTHIRMDMLVGALKGRLLWLFELISVLLMLLLIVALTWGAWEHFDRSFDCARPLCSRDSSIDIGIPIWPSKLVVPVAFFVLSLRLLLQAWGYGRALVLGLENPVAVPLNLTVAEQAMHEAEMLEGAD